MYNEENLFALARRQMSALKAAGFSAGEDVIDGDLPKYYMHDDAPELFMHSLDYDAYALLKSKNLIDTGTCPMCGHIPTANDYKFIDHKDHRLQFSICYQCHSDKQVNIKNLAKASKCYIATVCYESITTDEVITFRAYRDNVLRRSILGRTFISIYYFIAPSISNFLLDKPKFNERIIKYLLNPIYRKLKFK
jgi:hypothetical protein